MVFSAVVLENIRRGMGLGLGLGLGISMRYIL
jgi:hypothetical protein